MPNNLVYSLDEKFSLSGFSQRLDNFLIKGMEQTFQTFKGNSQRELAEMETVKAAPGQEFPQKDELALTRENHCLFVSGWERAIFCKAPNGSQAVQDEARQVLQRCKSTANLV